MSLNILKRVHSEAEIDYRTNVDGEWKIEIVCPNGEIKKPFGDKWRKNLIQDRFLNFLNGTAGSNSTPVIGGSPNNSGPSTDNLHPNASSSGVGVGIGILQSAYFGGGINSSNDPFATDKIFLTSSNANIWWTRRLTAADPDNLDPTFYEDDSTVIGSRTQKISWDFGAVSAGQTVEVQEIVIGRNRHAFTSSTASEQLNGSQGTFATSIPIVSRFILPTKITLTQFQFLRLRYRLKITIPALVTPVTINLTNNGFDAYGRLKLIGSWDEIFYNTNGTTFLAGTFGNNVFRMTPQVPWSLIDANGVGAVFLKGNATPTSNFDFPAVKSSFSITHANAWLANGNGVSNVTPGGSKTTVGVNDLAVVNGSVSSEATLLFPANNPSDGNPNGPIGGIIIVPGTQTDGSGNPMFGASSTNPTYPNVEGIGRRMWYWQFTDATFTNKVTRYKDPNYGLAINLRQTVSRG